MTTEKSKMIAGELYNANDPELIADRLRARQLCHDINHARANSPDYLQGLIGQLIPGAPASAYITPPRLYWSQRAVTGRPSACSGDM